MKLEKTVSVPGTLPRSIVRRIEVLTQRRIFRVAALGLLLAALELVTFSGYFTGSLIPPWDFLGSYNTDAYVWWSQGGFFTPIDWSASAWAGYPTALVLQNSAWYLPVGVLSVFGPYTLHSAAILAALHVSFGAIGTYFLARALNSTFVVGLLATAAGFFAVGYFSNAEHVDITRGYALVPWVLLVLSPRWAWRRLWSVPLAALILWQAITGIYPGMLVALGYVGIIWVAFWQLLERPRVSRYLLPAGLSFFAAVLLSMPRLLPYALLQGGVTAGLPEASQLTPTAIGTLLFGYGAPSLPNDISMRSFFVPAALLALAFFARWRDLTAKAGLAIGVPALLLGMPFWPWYAAEQALPGLGLSRFTMSDFKVFFILGIVLLSCSGLTRLVELARAETLPRDIRWSFAGVLVLAVALVAAALRGPYRLSDWIPGLFLFGLSAIAIIGFLFFRGRGGASQLMSGVLISITIVSGLVWSNTTADPWRASRLDSERVTYGMTVDALLAERSSLSPKLAQRPARTPLGADRSSAQQLSVVWNGSFYSGKDAVGGYINLKGSQTEALLQKALSDPESGGAFARFLASPGSILTTRNSTPSSTELNDCARGATCGQDTIIPTFYKPGMFEYRVAASSKKSGFLNEAYFAGWDAEICTKKGRCSHLDTAQSSLGVIRIALPTGQYDLRLAYHTAGREVGWILFGLGGLIALASMVAFGARAIVQKKRGTPTLVN